jgi:hypothetical protein
MEKAADLMTDPDRLAAIEAHLTDHQDIHEDDGWWLLGEVDRLRDEIAIAMRLADEEATEGRRLHALLARLEWEGGLDGAGICPVCLQYDSQGHNPGCWLAAELHPEREAAPARPKGQDGGS